MNSITAHGETTIGGDSTPTTESENHGEPADKLHELGQGDQILINDMEEPFTVKKVNPCDVVIEDIDGTEYSLGELPVGSELVTLEKITLGSDPIVVREIEVVA